MNMMKFILVIGLILILYSGLAFAQEDIVRLQSARIGSFGASFEMWKAGNDQISAFALPMSILFPANEKLQFYAVTSPSFSTLNNGTEYSLNGLSDLRWGGHCLLMNDHLLFTFGMSLPTGKSALTSDEYTVASVLAQPAFNFRVPSLGQGFDLQAGLNLAHDLGGFIIGGGVSFLKKGGFKPYDASDDVYAPGDEITLMGGFEKIFDLADGEMRLMGDILYTTFGDDRWDEEEVFRAGDRIIVQLTTTIPVDPVELMFLVRNRSKAKNKTGSEPFYQTERINTNANQFEVQAMGIYPTSDKVRWQGVLEGKFYSDNDFGYGGATLFGFGGGGLFGLSSALDFNLDVRYYLGKIKTGSDSQSALGLKIISGLQLTL